ncbi:hypothetical protein [Thiocapsa rosea]|uniref:Uncharacterized protein n=1 Tax=Thiocapsa rosea TaxID=69360 RepID=A0A495V8P8_9GAMM|nr:hypothetical protein [Thiocapsa rosea]RKT44737.1 hypothetical protein BDD21_2136 [Thiocapsa rosea]
MSDHGNGQQGHTSAAGQPAADAPRQGAAEPQKGAAAAGFALGAADCPPAQTQGANTPPPNGPHAGTAGPGMPGGYPGPGADYGQPGFGAAPPYQAMYPGMPPGMHPAAASHPAGYGLPPGIDPYWAAYHAQVQAQAGYAAPPPYAGMPQPGMPHPGYAPGFGAMPAQPTVAGNGHGHGQRGPGMSELVDEIANGGNGLSSLSKMLNLEDSEFWKGALLGAAAVLVLTNESVQSALFKTGAKAKSAVKTGVDRAKDGPRRPRPSDPSETSDV